MRLVSESATYSLRISFEFYVYSLDSDMKNKSHPKSDEMTTSAEGMLLVMIAWPYFGGKPIENVRKRLFPFFCILSRYAYVIY